MHLGNHADGAGRWRKYLPAMKEFWERGDLPKVFVPLQNMLIKHNGSYNNTKISKSEKSLLYSDASNSSLHQQIQDIVNYFEEHVAVSDEWKQQMADDPIVSIWAASMYYCYANVLKTYIIYLDGDVIISRIDLSKEYQKAIDTFDKGLEFYNLSKIRIELCFTYFESYLLESVQHTNEIVEPILSGINHNPIISNRERI